MSVKELIRHWQNHASGTLTETSYKVNLPLEDAAKLAALQALYPRRTQEQIITELLTAALHDLENSLPYEQGSKVQALDELGDPIYEDVGLTPKFLELSRQHLARLKQQKSA